MHRTVITANLLLSLSACGSSTGSSSSYDPAELERFKAALPAAEQLSAQAPASGAAASRALVGGVATFPVFAIEASLAINGTVTGLLAFLHLLVDVPPTSHDAATYEFVWGPWSGAPRFGKVAAYIKEQLPVAKSGDCASGFHVDPANAAQCLPDFHFVYALARGLTQDLTGFTPVIWGGANPDEAHPTHGTGVTLWDFEADYAFAQSTSCTAATPPTPCDATVDTTTFTRGRFVTLYGKDFTADTTDPADSTFAFDVAVFRGFIPEDKPSDRPVNAEYFYGSLASTVSVSFMNLHTLADLDPKDGSLEDLEIRVANLVPGSGRAEITAQCPAGAACSIPAGQQTTLVECWNPLLVETYLHVDSPDGSSTDPTGGTEANDCGAVFQNSLDALHIPTLDVIDPALMTKLEDVASHGMP